MACVTQLEDLKRFSVGEGQELEVAVIAGINREGERKRERYSPPFFLPRSRSPSPFTPSTQVRKEVDTLIFAVSF